MPSLLKRLTRAAAGAPAASPPPIPRGEAAAGPGSAVLERLRARAARPAAPPAPDQPSAFSSLADRRRFMIARAIEAVAPARPEDRPSGFGAVSKSIDEQIADAREARRLSGLASAQQVQDTREFRRVRDLPRRPFPPQVPDQTDRYARPGGTMRLKALQSAALVEAEGQGGAFVPLGVGAGKTLVSLLLPEAMGARRALLLIPARDRKKLGNQLEEYAPHFRLRPDLLQIHHYEVLSSQRNQDLLDRVRPDLIILDEAHKILRPGARQRRLKRYRREHPECRVVAMSGTFTKKKPAEFAWLMHAVMGPRAPLPEPYHECQEWSAAVQVDPTIGPGVLVQFCAPGESPRRGLGRRMAETAGVIQSTHDDVAAELVIEKLEVDVPDVVQDLLDYVRDTWELDGDVHEDPARHAADLRQVSQGFYLKWDWPDGIVDDEWVWARGCWHRAVCERLKLALRGQDSPGLCARAADSGKWDCDEWWAWKPHKDKKPPPTVAVWLSEYLIDDAVRRAVPGTIIWYENITVGDKLRARGVPTYGAGQNAEDAGGEVIGCSRGTQSEGKNLQKKYHRNIVLAWPSDGVAAQQMLGRTHRPHQAKESVYAGWYGHTVELEAAMQACRKNSRYVEEIKFEPMKLLRAREL